jgi:hypothetical protein
LVADRNYQQKHGRIVAAVRRVRFPSICCEDL